MKDCIVCNQQTLGDVVCPQCLQKELETIKQNTNSKCLDIIYDDTKQED